MVITVTCPSCAAAFPVDPAKIPEGGVNARCSTCGDIFRVEKPSEPEVPATLEAPEPTPEPVAAPEPVAEPEPTPEPVAAPQPPPMPDPTPVAASEPPPMPEPTPEPVAAPEPPPMPDPVPEPTADPFSEPAPFESSGDAASAAEPAVQGFTFGRRDPTDKAKRLARVLVSDMIMYNADRHRTALDQGTLVQDFEEEIQKSWKEYVEQVGEELANSQGREFWTDALNDILAKGQQVF